jgi:cold shock protein
MGRYKEYRGRERRAYGNEHMQGDQPPAAEPSNPGPAAPPASPPIEAIVKWFSAEKGFGFVELADGSAAYLHRRHLESGGQSSLPEGARVRVRIGLGHKGPEVTEIVEVDLSTARSGSSPARRASAPSRVSGPTIECVGTVKVYNAEKGFGFVGQDGGGKDVFFHVTALARAGLSGLTEGQRVRMQIGQGQKGLEAQTIKLLD